MGYIKHNAIIVTDWDEKRIQSAHDMAKQIFTKAFSNDLVEDGAILISDIVSGVVNSQSSFLVAPDGSKEGWQTSTNGDNARKEFLDWLMSGDCMCDYVEVRFGGDDEYNSIERSRHSDLENEDYR